MRGSDLLAGLRVRLEAAGTWLWAPVIGWVALVYLIVNFVLASVLPGSLNIYVVQPLLWSSLALLAFLAWKYGVEDKPRLSKSLVLMAALTGAFQLALFIIAGMLFGFGYSPYGHRLPVLFGNLLYAGTLLLGMEMSRACILGALGKRSPLLALVSVSLFFAFINIPIARLTSISDPPTLLRVSGETFLPTVAENLLASFLALLGGPVASIAYRGTLQAFEWLSPILPKLEWTITAFLGTLAPALGLLIIGKHVLPQPASGGMARPRGTQSITAWVLVAATAVALLWFNTGLLGVRPTLVSGVSMSPALQAGDVAITQDISADAVGVGDIIRFRLGGTYILHRVVAIQNDGNEIRFITRGDANNVDDPPLPASRLEGKVILVIPKIGWVGIAVRELIEWIQ